MGEFSRGKQIATLACGIAGVVLACTYGVGIIPSIIALVLSGQASKVGDDSKMVKIGKILGIVGIVLSAIMLIVCIVAGGSIAAMMAGAGSY